MGFSCVDQGVAWGGGGGCERSAGGYGGEGVWREWGMNVWMILGKEGVVEVRS